MLVLLDASEAALTVYDLKLSPSSGLFTHSRQTDRQTDSDSSICFAIRLHTSSGYNEYADRLTE